MIIQEHQVACAEGKVRVSAQVTLEGRRGADRSLSVWYEFPEAYAPYVSSRADGFVVGLLFLAVWLQEDIKVAGTLSSRLAHGLREYQRVFSIWFPRVRPVEIIGDRSEDGRGAPTEGAVGSYFSGGVDSFFTLWSHLAEREPDPDFRITHGLFVHGLDIGLGREDRYREARHAYRALFEGLGLSLIPVRTNLKGILNHHVQGWRGSFGTLLISVCLQLQGLFARCYVPSSLSYGAQEGAHEGTDPLVDHLLSTGSLQVIHDGAWATRLHKVRTLSEWPATYRHLSVCHGREGLVNCCRCDKCICTMLELELAGKLSNYSTFPRVLRPRDILRWRMPDYEVTRPFAKELLSQARAAGRADLAVLLRYVIWRHDLQRSGPGRAVRQRLAELARRAGVNRRLPKRAS